MRVNSIAECSTGALGNTFDLQRSFCNTFTGSLCDTFDLQGAFCNTSDLHLTIIGLKNHFLSSLKWPLKTGLLYHNYSAGEDPSDGYWHGILISMDSTRVVLITVIIFSLCPGHTFKDHLAGSTTD